MKYCSWGMGESDYNIASENGNNLIFSVFRRKRKQFKCNPSIHLGFDLVEKPIDL